LGHREGDEEGERNEMASYRRGGGDREAYTRERREEREGGGGLL
jgi:hypothetical protein